MDVENQINIMSMQGVLSNVRSTLSLKDMVESDLKNDPIECEGNFFLF